MAFSALLFCLYERAPKVDYFSFSGYGKCCSNAQDYGLRPERQPAQLRPARQGGDQEYRRYQEEQRSLGKTGGDDQKNFKERKFRRRLK